MMNQKKIIGLMASLFIGSTVSAHSYYTHVDTPDVQVKQLTAQHVPHRLLTDNQFIFRPVKNPFEVKSFLQQNAPQWVFLSEDFNHWAGATTVSPQIMITLLAVTDDWPGSSTPDAAEKMAIKQKIKHFANHLSQYYYSYRSGKYELSSYTPATLAVINELGSYGDWKKFQQQYQAWFPEDEVASLLQTQNLSTAATVRLPEKGFMQMPWLRGYSWVPNGPHSYTGSGFPLSSFDASYDWPQWGATTYAVAAANTGTVSVLSNCEVRVTNANGWATNYYHMADIQVRHGQQVDQNTILGYYASNKSQALCSGGSSTGPHLHFSVLYNGAYHSIQGMTFGPYKIQVGTYSYDDNCSDSWMTDTRTNRKICFWNRIENPENY